MGKFVGYLLLIITTFELAAAYFGSLPLIQPEQLNRSPDNYVVIDVRSAEEFHSSHIPGAINIPHNKISEHIEAITSWSTKPIVVHCKSGYRAWLAEKELLALGVQNLHHLAGDFNAWQDKKLPVVVDKE